MRSEKLTGEKKTTNEYWQNGQVVVCSRDVVYPQSKGTNCSSVDANGLPYLAVLRVAAAVETS